MSADPSPLSSGGRVTIDLGALVDNWRAVAAHVDKAQTAAALKADAYGLGLERVAIALARAGCKTFFVALPAEGVALRRHLPDVDIYVLNGLLKGQARGYIHARLRPVLASMAEVEEWAAAAPGEASALHVDTGMHRLGLPVREALALADNAALVRSLVPTLVMSHLACADTPHHPLNARQLALFQEVRARFADVPASLANSAGIFLGQAYHFDLVRPGIALYGARFADDRPPLKTVVTLEAQVLQVHEASVGETVGYGATQTFRRPTRVAVLSAGYADGYHRAASSSDARNGARVWIDGQFAPIVGRVSMDLMAVDVTDAPAVERGDWAELFGPHVPVDEVSAHAGTIGYELLTALGGRYEHVYLGG